MSNMDLDATDYAGNPGVPRNYRTVFDDLEPAFKIVEYLATPDATAAFPSEVFSMLELVVVARYPIYHTCAPHYDRVAFPGLHGSLSTQ